MGRFDALVIKSLVGAEPPLRKASAPRAVSRLAALPSIWQARRGSLRTATRLFWFGRILTPLMSAALPLGLAPLPRLAGALHMPR